MATHMIDSVTVTRESVFKGAGWLVVSDPDVLSSFPGRLESVMQPSVPADAGETAYALETGWTSLGPTPEDGFTITREAEIGDGIPIDQRQHNLDEGEPDNWQMRLETALLHTNLATVAIAWEGGTLRTFAADATHVAQSSLDLDAPLTFTERMAAVIQEDPASTSGKLRIFVFRKAIPQVSSDLNIQSKEATQLPFTLTLKADESIAEGSGQFGKIFEED